MRHLSPDLETYLLTFLGSFPSILIACAISYGLSRLASSTPAFAETPLTVGSFGATAVLLYATPEAPLSQPRNVILGHTLSALVGAVVSQLFALDDRFTKPLADGNDNTLAAGTSWPSLVPLSGAFAVGLATLGMQLTGTVHPPGESVRTRETSLALVQVVVVGFPLTHKSLRPLSLPLSLCVQEGPRP